MWKVFCVQSNKWAHLLDLYWGFFVCFFPAREKYSIFLVAIYDRRVYGFSGTVRLWNDQRQKSRVMYSKEESFKLNFALGLSFSLFSFHIPHMHSLSCNKIQIFLTCELHQITIILWRSQDRNHCDHIRVQLQCFIPKWVIHHSGNCSYKMMDYTEAKQMTHIFKGPVRSLSHTGIISPCALSAPWLLNDEFC